MNLKNLRIIEKSLSGNLSPREKKYLEKMKSKDPGIVDQLEDFGDIRKAFSETSYQFSPAFTAKVMESIEQQKVLPVTIPFTDIIQKAFMRVAIAGFGLLLVLISLSTFHQSQQNEQYPVEALLASESLLFDYYYYEMN